MPAPNNGAMHPELKSAIDALRAGIAAAAPASKLAQLQAQVDAIDKKLIEREVSSFMPGGLRKSLEENESIARILRDRKGSAYITLKGRDYLEATRRKGIISGIASGSSEGDSLYPVGTATTGVLQIDRIPGITMEARQVLKVRDVLPARPTVMQVVDFVKVSSPMSIASPVPEASVKPENVAQFTSISEKVRLLATWIPATKQVLDDMTNLQSFLTDSLSYYVDLEEELQLLSGDDTGENLHGLIPQAQAFNTGFLSPKAGWQRIDVIGQAIQQINSSKEIDPTFVVLNTVDYWALRLTKDSFGRYLIGDPQSPFRPNLFGLDMVYTTSIPAGTFLIGNGNPVAVEIRDRMELQIELSTEHSDYFVASSSDFMQ